jgi:hypothetical protein
MSNAGAASIETARLLGQHLRRVFRISKLPAAVDKVGLIAPLFVVGLAFALLGWAILVLTSRLERDRQARHPDLFSEQSPALTQRWPWIRSLGKWLLR